MKPGAILWVLFVGACSANPHPTSPEPEPEVEVSSTGPRVVQVPVKTTTSERRARSEETARARENELFAKFSEFADRFCACENPECIGEVQEELAEFAKANADVQDTPEMQERAQPITERMTECVRRVVSDDS